MATKKILITIDTKEHADNSSSYLTCKECMFLNNCQHGNDVCYAVRLLGIDIDENESIINVDVEEVTE